MEGELLEEQLERHNELCIGVRECGWVTSVGQFPIGRQCCLTSFLPAPLLSPLSLSLSLCVFQAIEAVLKLPLKIV